ncbi:MAG: hypothetical protein JXB85_10170 [Anaerolineales bacterium]|nr:hypothetical protein [Anaerolineales bacterium]
MSESIFDRLQKKLDVQKHEEGISAGDIAELPPALRKIMRMMLREVELTYKAICAAMDEMPAPDRMNRQELDQALETLTSQNWLIRRGEGEGVNYMVNLRRKAGSSLGLNFWDSLDEKIATNKKDAPPE